ncbi:MAG TPA: hypothetical protein VGY97_03565 [Solirubrobacteraceae bacterium]|jgi:hypothetical protein|nr:hypothetical protein [Solirubrobacteraceae bacterium]
MAERQTGIFQYVPHPRIAARRQHRPPKVHEEPTGGPMQRFNARAGLFITLIVGTMWCAYLFTLIALVSLPQAIKSGDKIIIISWIAQTFLQLVLLPIIIVGQNQQAVAADKRAEQTYKDADATLHEAMQLQAHLMAQDGVLDDIVRRLTARFPPPQSPGTPSPGTQSP